MTVKSTRPSRWTNALLIVASILISVVVAEGVVRCINGQPLFAFPLPDAIGSATVKAEELDKVPLAAGDDRAWFYSDPAPLPRSDPPKELQQLFDYLQDHPSGTMDYRPNDAFKVWNSVFAGDPCRHRFLRNAPSQLYVYDPPDGLPSPPYRFYPNATLPDHLVTNQIGWRGRPIEVPRKPRTVRIVFVGASTTINSHFLPFSYPEYVGHWLNMWAQAKHLDVQFEALNAGRESVVSTDIAAIVHTEVLPLHPDLVVYYEGANQFRPASIVDKVPEASTVQPPSSGAHTTPEWMREAARYSALMGRVVAAAGYGGSDRDGHEWPKPDYKVVWPPGLDEFDPDLSYPNLPVNLNVIEHDLDRIRADLATVGSQLALSSFVWLVKDGMVLDPVRNKYILEQLNIANYPFRYRDLERLAKFQNRVFAKYAKVHDLPFVDVAGNLPFDPDLFIDAIHLGNAGVRLAGWIVFQQLLPTVEGHLADGSWPTPVPADQPLPIFDFRKITFNCTRPGN
ncbi:MAG: hypothetical protein ACHQPH_09190 [Reyranellales bacterium]